MVTISGKIIPLIHTICASSAFLAAFVTGYTLHFHKIVTNAHYTYPDEWFPSVSATIGDRYPERSIFQILIALTAFPRFLLLLGQYYLTNSVATFIIGILRTVSCGGWVYITSTDDHDTHDIFMIIYIILTLPWDIMITRLSKTSAFKKGLTATIFFTTLVPMIYWYIQHQIEKRPGAYSIYAYFEWSLIILDITFDAFSYSDFKSFSIVLDMGKNPITGFYQIGELVANESGENKLVEETIVEQAIKQSEPVQQDETKNESDIIDKKEVADKSSYPFSYDSFFYLLTNTFNSLIFWSNLTALTCSIWHFPLWYMGISGYEAAILGYLGPIILYLPFMPTIIFHYGILLGGLTTIGAFLINTPETRLITVSIGTAITMGYFTQNLRTIQNIETKFAFAFTWALGLAISVVLKMGFYSNNPIWPILNETMAVITILGMYFGHLVFGMLTPFTNQIHKSQKASMSLVNKSNCLFVHKLAISLGFGSLVFGIHQLMTDASTTIYWSWEGYNERGQGPLAWPWSALTCLVMLVAVLTSYKFSTSPLFPSLFLVLSTAVLCNRAIVEWNKYIFGGLLYIIAMIWLIPIFFNALSLLNSIWVFVFGFFTYIILVLAHVWVVAYAFVPFGWLLRERIETVLSISTLLILMGVVSSSALVSNNTAMIPTLSKKFIKIIALFSVLVLSLIATLTYQIRPTGVPQPYHPESRLFTAGIWTIHFGLDNDMWASEDRMSSLIKDMELDFVGLLETDTQRITMGNRDLTSKLAHDLNMYADFGPGPNKHTWGCLLLSKFPIINSTHHLLPSPDGELAPAIHAVVKTYDDILVDVFVFHSGQEEDIEDRRLQSEGMAALMGSTDRPSILLSYLVTEPGVGNYNTYVSERSGMHDIDPTDSDRWCEYILYKGLRRTGYARVSRGTITDTELQVGKFQVLSKDETKRYGSSIYRYEHVDEPQAEDMKFPDKFNGDGERGHFYHVFDKPRYYDF
ncbi:Cwh43p NDAI_0G04980 [Naumovozyma dairenensis CBS 421]|uniref:Protein CWH43 n=1 Tax=Naumovozyma dairenensis (strain ATCC 10597 / BCRC 20456 / CBS 421 / NBRC 0211 / NRRL Y-12639) TaxID=1071378 RepID=J7S4J1_NAUDC|nr:hypothetical protein NDAI_0G04980 [Naumovozyma dairenensis CBS 421]CCK73481.1 hypothetical protein NDAI_0G04980 [Naumovozyma dairenensis CBS 421]